ncbi:MAG: hypothetical protein J0H62_02910 [Rhizobiales bacterium]|nr:hypothetical protein [Hyphomicrobiales bacterium]
MREFELKIVYLPRPGGMHRSRACARNFRSAPRKKFPDTGGCRGAGAAGGGIFVNRFMRLRAALCRVGDTDCFGNAAQDPLS